MNLEIMSNLNVHLLNYADPKNPKGFFPTFVDWVIAEWSSRPYFKIEKYPTRYELANFPIRTDYLLKEMQPIYRDFIHSYTGRHHYLSSHSKSDYCETMEKELYDYFHETVRLEGIRFLESAFPEVEAEDFWDRIFMEEFQDDEEMKMMDKLCLNFGFYALTAEPYTCLPPDILSSEPGEFSEWYLDDFINVRSKLAKTNRKQRRRQTREQQSGYPKLPFTPSSLDPAHSEQ